ncbi:hypothetical protein B566_EDAN011246, partial [Ephemera danica]
MVVSNRVRVQTLLSSQMCAIRILAYTALVNQGLNVTWFIHISFCVFQAHFVKCFSAYVIPALVLMVALAASKTEHSFAIAQTTSADNAASILNNPAEDKYDKTLVKSLSPMPVSLNTELESIVSEMVVSNRVRVQTLLSYQMCAIRILAYTALVNQGLNVTWLIHISFGVIQAHFVKCFSAYVIPALVLMVALAANKTEHSFATAQTTTADNAARISNNPAEDKYDKMLVKSLSPMPVSLNTELESVVS